ncbi:NAD(P)H-dependent flavin oxidoreductase YrpB, nitropropane dioxygenase family [Hathewaya proteolytica DSM 3090]|uniref:Probable nitronate monooxygenase n=1 Tax=Hathewaya proteolytica DSM 3090 TaxID=1121331 RepID=A0A1M6M1W2_9CLOT|nr:nitronate monooxygenase [Hathewaya proteolytica]SHJ77459.1 NAD(P)H-dependent flavin oxidoreductase YrpB, nitropropane dioxygenase family [Hathewaya proteolytica DSM 3090]
MKIGNRELQIPIVQGGMGIGISLGNLAGAVAACGGMGVISAANPGFDEEDFWTNSREANTRALKREIKKAKKLSGGRGMIGVNIMVAMEDYELLVRDCIDAGADCIISGAGLPKSLPEMTAGADILIAPIISSARGVHTICKLWKRRYNRLPDFVVVEGSKAGGHLGFSREELLDNKSQSLEEIYKEVREMVDSFQGEDSKYIPIVVAGGISYDEDVKKYLDLGANAVQVATRFIATEECDASKGYKDIVINATKEDIRIVQSPVGMPGRALYTPLIQRMEKEKNIRHERCINCIVPCNPSTTPYCITKALIEAQHGNYEEGLFFVGAEGYKMDKIVKVHDVIDELMGKVNDY